MENTSITAHNDLQNTRIRLKQMEDAYVRERKARERAEREWDEADGYRLDALQDRDGLLRVVDRLRYVFPREVERIVNEEMGELDK